MTRNWKKGVVAAALIAALALAGCAPGTDDGGDPSDNGVAPSGTLELGTLTAPSTLVAANAYWSNESPYLQAVYDTLIHSESDGSFSPALATEWKYNDDQTLLTIKLRDDVTFTDGEKFDSEVAAENLLRFRDGSSPSKNLAASIEDVAATDASTIEIQLSEPNPALLRLLSQNGGLMASPATFDDPDAELNPVGTGPYTLNAAESVLGTKYVFDYNPNYWNPESIHYAKINMAIYEAPEALVNAVKGGQVNASNTSTNRVVEEIQSAGFDVVQGTFRFAGVLLWDRDGTLVPALKDVRVRQAINYAIDREKMLEVMNNGAGEMTSQIFPTSSEGYDPELDDYYEYNPEKAKELLAEAGYADGFTITMQNSLISESVHALYAQQLADVGITVQFDNSGANVFGDMMGGKFPASVFFQQQDVVDWQLSNFLLTENAPWNPFHVKDEKVAELTDVLQRGSDAERVQAAKELNRYTVEQAWYAPWFRPFDTFVVDANTTAEWPFGQSHPNLWTIQSK